MTIIKNTLASITYQSPDIGPDAPCAFVWTDNRTETHPKSWTGFFRGVVGGRNSDGAEAEWYDGTGMNAETSVAAASGLTIGAYAAPEEPA